ncbi:MAG TPA: rod shape-determining protein MreC [Bacteroidales bacterium]|nr:rod shape-determining protein MreC [Bacteroidales bacterium]HOL99002.1 rod shape-determining protein MreC [Bacteroidales bacterium]HOM37305.1 rod shape-determining protein MreC [Bacteroidales bacterium]HPD24799.1 rod shape-determining protein MreC [Bacteroidales bacterium]HRT00576.1 rod shape-determining protein MreC [Bacteroidales bacterium]
MKNLIRFIINNDFFLTFLLIQIFCFTLLFSYNPYHRSYFFNSSNVLSGIIQEKHSNITEYFYLKHVNDSLIAENERLRNQIEKYRREEIPPILSSGFSYIAAKVVGISVNKIDNYITINKGKNHGVYNEMGVISSNGLVGIVISVSSNYSTILPLINPQTKISVKIKKNNYFGSLSWIKGEANYGLVTEIPGYVQFEEGDEIVTSGFSAIFPENIPVGNIVSSEIDPTTRFHKIKIRFNTDFYNLHYVYLIKNKNFEEHNQIISELEKKND